MMVVMGGGGGGVHGRGGVVYYGVETENKEYTLNTIYIKIWNVIFLLLNIFDFLSFFCV